MASWGPKLYQDDVAEEIRDQFNDLLKRGKTAVEITDKFLEDFGDEIEDGDDAPVFWFALADTQWKLGRLLPEVKAKALQWIEAGTDQARWEEESPSEAKVRLQVLAELKHKLNSPMPPEKKVPQYKLYRCEWKLGDVFAYLMEHEDVRESGLMGRYVLLIKVDEDIWHPGHITPIVRIKVCAPYGLPQNEHEIDELPYLALGCPIDGELPYLMQLISTSKRIIPKKLIYLGNVPGVKPPTKERIPEHKISIQSLAWKRFETAIALNYIKNPEWKKQVGV